MPVELSSQAALAASCCRVCGGKDLRPVITLPGMPLTDDFVSVDSPNRQEYVADIGIAQCLSCGTVQNPVDFDFGGYYRDYAYSSGHSAFTRGFMRAYAESTVDSFRSVNGFSPRSVLEIGSGDGTQLQSFLDLGIPVVRGVEPSEVLAAAAVAAGVPTSVALFDDRFRVEAPASFDICLSSYTFDHVRNPVEYLQTANRMQTEGGILAVEIHDLTQIVSRGEFCLFEHEHTVYLGRKEISWLAESCGYRILACNPLPSNQVRGNSLIAVAVKVGEPGPIANPLRDQFPNVKGVAERVSHLVQAIERWIAELPPDARLVGFGAGGRGVMTLAGLPSHDRFEALLDSNYPSHTWLTPRTRIPVMGPDEWRSHADAYCLVFSFGYLAEITESLLGHGFERNRIFSLLDFY